MTDQFKKLNFKGNTSIVVLNEPASFIQQTDNMLNYARILKTLEGVIECDFVLAFVTSQFQVDQIANKVAPIIKGDGILWFAYPKKTSTMYKCDINRDKGWGTLTILGFEPVRQIAIDTDWSVLRFRRIEFIKKMTRKWTHS